MWQRTEMISYFLQFLPLHISFFYEVSVATLLCEFSEILKTRYDFMTNKLQQIFERNQSEERFDKEINRIRTMYRILHEIVNRINRIFGNIILIFLTNLQIFILTVVYWEVFYWKNDLRLQLIIGSFMTLSFFSVSVFKIMSVFVIIISIY